ncbi:hypothetical protein Brsp06_04748 [Brucella sp. NBRC 13694]|jgi:hypothetical protein|nr:hypothetical protein BG46_20390 [Brucella anthropi]
MPKLSHVNFGDRRLLQSSVTKISHSKGVLCLPSSDGLAFELLDILERVEALGVDAAAATLIEDARDQIRRSGDEVEERKRERDEETDSDADWTHIVTQKKEDAIVSAALPTTRSIFDDVDK